MKTYIIETIKPYIPMISVVLRVGEETIERLLSIVWSIKWLSLSKYKHLIKWGQMEVILWMQTAEPLGEKDIQGRGGRGGGKDISRYSW